MKKLILIIPFILFSCSKPTEMKMEILKDSSISISDENQILLDKMEHALEETEGLEVEIGETYKTKETLIKENKILKKEIKSMKDSLVEIKTKLPKKQNFIQKVFNITPDTIEIITLDTIKQ